MHFYLMAFGSRGDVQPYVALALRLQAAGHQATVVGLDDYAELAAAWGVDYHPLGFRLADADHGQFVAALESGRNSVKGVLDLLSAMRPLFDRMLETLYDVYRQADAVVASLVALVSAQPVAEKYGIPYFVGMLQPIGRTRHFPGPAFPLTGDYGPAFNLLTHRFTELLFTQPMLPFINRWRRDYFDLPPLPPLAYPYEQVNGQPVPWLYAYSPHVIPHPEDWPPHRHTTGYWHLPTQAAWQPPDDLAAFLADGPPPVYIGFGSMMGRDTTALTRLVVQALDRASLRGVLLTPGERTALDGADLPESVFVLSGAPHDWLFPRMAAVVHHGGAGTTAAGMRAGVPSVIVPFMGDQPFWAQRVVDLGIGPAPIPRRSLTADGLAYALRIATEHAPMQARAATLGERLRAEDGVGAAMQVINAHLQRR